MEAEIDDVLVNVATKGYIRIVIEGVHQSGGRRRIVLRIEDAKKEEYDKPDQSGRDAIIKPYDQYNLSITPREYRRPSWRNQYGR